MYCLKYLFPVALPPLHLSIIPNHQLNPFCEKYHTFRFWFYPNFFISLQHYLLIQSNFWISNGFPCCWCIWKSWPTQVFQVEPARNSINNWPSWSLDPRRPRRPYYFLVWIFEKIIATGDPGLFFFFFWSSVKASSGHRKVSLPSLPPSPLRFPYRP